MSKQHIWQGRRAARSSTSQENAEPLCDSENQRRESRGFLGGKLITDHVLFSSYESQRGAANGQDSWGVFQGCAGLWTSKCWLARQLYRLKSSIAMDLGTTISLISVLFMCGLEKLGLVDQEGLGVV